MIIKLDQGKYKRKQEIKERWYLVETASPKWTISISRVKMFAINQSETKKRKKVESTFKYQAFTLNNSCSVHK